MLVGRDLGLPNLVVLVVIFVIFPAIGFVIRRKWLHAAARSEEIKRLLIFASEEAARAEIEATEGHFYTSNTSPSVPSPPSAWVPAPDSGWVQPTVSTPPVAPSLKPPYQCAVCFSPTSTRCAKCKAARYCSGRCQIIHWRQGHKDECRPYVAVKPVKDISATSSDSHATSTDGIGSAFDSSSSEEYSTFSTPSRASTEASSVSSGDSDVNFVNVESSTASVKVDQSQPSHSDEDIHPRFSTSSSQVYDVPGPSSRPSFSDPSTTSSGFLGGTHHSKKSSIDELDSSSKNTTMLDNPAPNGSGRHKSNDEIMSKEMPFNGLMSTKPPKHNSEMFKETKISSPSIKDSKPFGSMPPAVPGKSTHMVNAKSVTSSPLKSTSRLASQYTKPLSVHEEKDKVSSFSSKLAEHSRSGRNEIKTSMLKVVDQPKPSKLTRHHTQRAESETTHKSSCKGLFSYDAFVKLYNWNQIGLRPFGLINCGNSCYANSVLQCLTHTPPLYAYFLQGLHSKACHKRDWCFTCEFEGLVLKAKNGSSSLSPIRILSQIENIGSSLNHGTQEDAHEFLRYAIDALQSVCLKEAGAKATNSLEEETTLVGLTFGGYLRSKIKCMKCGGKSERHDRMMDLTVEIEGNIGTLEEALNKFTCTEILDGENKYKCSRCKSYERAKKKLTLLEAPNVLTIALKRFQSGKYGKLNKSIDFPEILDMAPYVSGTSDKSPVYKLYGAVVHLDTMNAAFSGHYVCYVKNVENRWYKIDDYKVKEVDVQSVLKKGAYLLLYARCSPRAPKLIRSLLSRDHHDPRKHKMLLRSQHQRPTQPWDDHLAIRHRSLEEESSSSSDGSGILSESCSCSTESSQRTSSSIEDHIPWDWEHDEHSNSNSISSSPLWRNLHLNSSDSDTSSSSSSSSSFRPPLLYSRHSTLYHNDSSNSFRDVDRLGGRPTEPAKPALRRSTGRVRSE